MKKCIALLALAQLPLMAWAGSVPPAPIVVPALEAKRSDPCFVELVTTSDHLFLNTRYVEKITVSSTNLDISMARTRNTITYKSNALAIEAAKNLVQKIQACKVT